MKTIVVLYGGRSTEHEVAVRSANTIINNLDRSKYIVYGVYVDKSGKFIPYGKIDKAIDSTAELTLTTEKTRLESISDFCSLIETLDNPMIFPAIHGQTGEDGEIQGFLQTLGLSYIGNRLTASALCMDKGFANEVLKSSGISKSAFVVLTLDEYNNTPISEIIEKIETICKLPCFVKPANNGSSVGVNRATKETLPYALKEAFKYDTRVVIEEEIKGCELEVSVIGNFDAKASLPGSYTYVRDVLDYTAKYSDSQTIENVPHKLEEDKTKELQKLALRTYHALGCEGMARVDIFMDNNGEFFVNEVNTFPGMTQTSLAPKLWVQLTDMSFSDYLDVIIDSAEASENNRNNIVTSWEEA